MNDPAASRTNDLAPLLQGFFTDKLMRQRQASPHTIAAYRDTFKLLLQFTGQRIRRQPAELGLADLDAALVGAFLQHLQAARGNSGSTRNARLAGIHSFFGYAAVHAPQHAALIQQVLAIPPQRRDRAIVDYLTPPEAEALIDAPDRTRGSAAATTSCSKSLSTQGCESPNSPRPASATSTSGRARTCAAPAKDANSDAHH